MVVRAKGWPYDQPSLPVERAGVKEAMQVHGGEYTAPSTVAHTGEQPDASNPQAGGAADSPASAGDDVSDRIERLIAHCNTAKATQPLHNKAHHDRWTHVKGLIGVHDFEGAKAYARLWAAKNWQAWVDLETMLDG